MAHVVSLLIICLSIATPLSMFIYSFLQCFSNCQLGPIRWVVR